MALFRGIQEYIALDANNITLVFDSGNIVNILGNIFLYPPQSNPIFTSYTMGFYEIPVDIQAIFLVFFSVFHEPLDLKFKILYTIINNLKTILSLIGNQ